MLLARRLEQAALGAVRLEHANEQLQVCHEAVGHSYDSNPILRRKLGAAPTAEILKISVAIAEKP